jgi:hypothetical protein
MNSHVQTTEQAPILLAENTSSMVTTSKASLACHIYMTQLVSSSEDHLSVYIYREREHHIICDKPINKLMSCKVVFLLFEEIEEKKASMGSGKEGKGSKGI